MHSADDPPQAELAFWLEADTAHAAAYARVAAAHARAQELADQSPLLALRQAALARTMLARPSRRLNRRAIVAAGLLLVGTPLAALGFHVWPAPTAAPTSSESFRTGTGQQAEVTLPDGSTVTLDTNSRMNVRFDNGERHVTLHGQGWFTLKPSRLPFTISAGGRDFTTDSGSFDVRTDPGQVRAFAADGTLVLSTQGQTAIRLEPGRSLEVRGGEVLIRARGDAAGLTDWREGLLHFDDVPLAVAVSELNRYRRRPIHVADARAAGLRVSGTFHTTESAAFIDAATSAFPLHVKQDSSAGIVIASR